MLSSGGGGEGKAQPNEPKSRPSCPILLMSPRVALLEVA